MSKCTICGLTGSLPCGCTEDFDTMKKEHKQEILKFISEKRDHAAVWEFIEFIPNDPGRHGSISMQDRTGQWWLVSRYILNTTEQARKYFINNNYWQVAVTLVELNATESALLTSKPMPY